MLVEFTSGGCKVPGVDPYDGLECVGWSLEEGGSATIRLVNFTEACLLPGDPAWEGAASLRGSNRLDLRVASADDVAPACGDCTYDWTFVVDGLSCESDLGVQLETSRCTACTARGPIVAVLPVTESPEGMICRYLIPLPESVAVPGTTNMPCCTDPGAPGCSTDTTPCSGDLLCREVPPAGGLCVQPCTGDVDCAPGEVMSCQGGICLPDGDW